MRSPKACSALTRLLICGLAFWSFSIPTRLSLAQFIVAQQQQDVVAVYLFNGQDETTFKRRLESTSSLRLKRMIEVLDLDPKQQDELDLALRGDISRFYRDIAATRKKTEGLNIRNQNEMQKAWQLIQPLRTKITETGLVGDGSLFERVLQSILTAEQEQIYDAYQRSREEAKVKALTLVALSQFEEAIPLKAAQREEILALLTKAKYPVKLRRGMENQVGFSIIAKLPDEEVKEILDEKQYAAFEKFSKQFKNRLGGLILW